MVEALLKLTPYVRDSKSYVLYLLNPQVLAVHFQSAESAQGLLDLEFQFESKVDHSGKFLLRLEGSEAELELVARSIAVALRNPRPHPSPADLFEDALIDRTGLSGPMQQLYAEAYATRGFEVERARAEQKG